MRLHILTVVVFITCSSFFIGSLSFETGKANCTSSNKNVFDFSVHRLTGEKVLLTWHTQNELPGVVYEVMRKHNRLALFISMGVIQPKSKNESSADYSFVDANNYADSSYYCLKKVNTDSVIFYSVTKGVEGIGTNR